MLGRIILGGLLLLSLSCCLLAAGCNSGPRISGDTLVLPASARLMKKESSSGLHDTIFHRFNQEYPRDWPAGFQLPAGSFLMQEELTLKDPKSPVHSPGQKTISFSGVAPLTAPEAIKYFRNATQAAGYTIEKEVDLGVGLHDISCMPGPSAKYPYLMVKIHLDRDFGRWAYFTGFLTVDTTK